MTLPAEFQDYLAYCGGYDRLTFNTSTEASEAARQLRARTPTSVSIEASYNTVVVRLCKESYDELQGKGCKGRA